MEIEQLEASLLGISDLDGDCDAISDLISIKLDSMGITHERYCGYVEAKSTAEWVLPHCWIECKINNNDYIIDFRLTKWLSSDKYIHLHGVFHKKSHINVVNYIGNEDLRVKTDTLSTLNLSPNDKDLLLE